LFFKFIGKSCPDYNDDRIIVQVFTPPIWFFNFFIINQNGWKIIKELDIIQMTIHYGLVPIRKPKNSGWGNQH